MAKRTSAAAIVCPRCGMPGAHVIGRSESQPVIYLRCGLRPHVVAPEHWREKHVRAGHRPALVHFNFAHPPHGFGFPRLTPDCRPRSGCNLFVISSRTFVRRCNP
jgi:hypothetical protein